MGARQSKPGGDKRERYLDSMREEIGETLHRRSVLPVRSDIPTPFTKFQSLSEEWNLCGRYDAMRRVNVVADLKLQRKKLPYLFVEKCVRLRDSEALDMLRNELEVLLYLVRYAQLNIGFMHPNVLQLRGYFAFHGKIHVFVEFGELGSIHQAYIESPNPMFRLVFAPTASEIRDAMRQICAGVASLHANGVAHCDLALENIFITAQSILKIGDFDRAVFVGSENVPQRPRQTEPLRRVYGAPELYLRPTEEQRVDLLKADAWAVGVILVMLFTKRAPFDTTQADDKGLQLYKKIGLRGYLKAMYLEQSAVCKIPDEAIALGEGLLHVDPTERWSLQEALACEWLAITSDEDDHLVDGEATMKKNEIQEDEGEGEGEGDDDKKKIETKAKKVPGGPGDVEVND